MGPAPRAPRNKAIHAASTDQPRGRPHPVAYIRDRVPGADPCLPDAEGARSARRSEYRRLCLGVPRIAAWWSRTQQFIRAARRLAAADIKFQPGINEELAATALWGTQQAELRGEGKFNGVFGMWYGKGPGVDRTGDAFRHANLAGSSKHGGVIALMGDDHTAESDHRASVGVPFRRRDDADSQSRRRAGIRRLRIVWLGDVAFQRRLGGAQVHARDGGIDRGGRRKSSIASTSSHRKTSACRRAA